MCPYPGKHFSGDADGSASGRRHGDEQLMRWSEFAAAARELAELGTEGFEFHAGHGNHT
jgi:hypothetical protein